jgi:probable lipoprotein NlpC
LQYTALLFIIHSSIIAQSHLDFQEAYAYLTDTARHTSHSDSTTSKPVHKMSKLDELIYYAESYLGTPYRFGGTSEAGLDCSGFMNKIFGWLDQKIPRSSRDIAHLGYQISWNEVSKGDMMFFRRSTKSKDIGHVAMVVEVGENTIKIIHASTTRGVVIENIYNMPYYLKRFVMAKRLDY